MNKIIKLLMLSDIFFLTGFGLIGPILAIFIKENLVGGTIFAAGIASTIFIVTKSAIQLPFSRYSDKHDHKIIWLIIGSVLFTIVPFIYIFADNIQTIYIAQVIQGIGSGFAFPTWLGLWSTHLDKKKEAFEWSLYSTVTGVGSAITAAGGAAIAEFVGFEYAFLAAGLLSIVGCIILFGLETSKSREKIPIINYHKKKKMSSHYVHNSARMQ